MKFQLGNFMTKPLRILHTSDWHLGRMLHGRQRHEEFKAFLNWLHETAVQHKADILAVAGDIFDTTTPGTKTQQLYYNFLCQMAASPCRHLIVTAGNHDSPSFLSAPKELLRALNIHVIAAKGASPADEVLLLRNQEGEPEAIVCAVPFLRDRDLRTAAPGQSMEERERDLAAGILRHYAAVCAAAEAVRQNLPQPVPVIGMGHLFAAGGSVVEGDGSHRLYVGDLARVGADAFPPLLDYVALGHLHTPQLVQGKETCRYSGAPLVMSFAEAGKEKSICLVDFTENGPQVRTLPAPIFQEIRSIRGSWLEIAEELDRLRAEQRRIWLEVVHEDSELISDLRERVEQLVAGSGLEVLRIRSLRPADQSLSSEQEGETLAELEHEQVFLRCLAAHEISAEQQPGLLTAYQEISHELCADDPLAGQ
jgi:exonuclease SbcD